MKKKKSRKKKRLIFIIKSLLFFIVVAGITVFGLNSDYFNIKAISVAGNNKFDSNKIISMSGINEGQNIFKIDDSFAKRSIMQNQYIDSVSVERKFPQKVVIHIKERTKFAMVHYNNYVEIDKNGNALEINADKPINANKSSNEILVTGLKYDFVKLGEKINFKNYNSYKDSIIIINLLKKYMFSDKIKELDASDDEALTLYDNYNRKIILYDTNNIENKIKILKSILNKLGPFEKGTVDFGYKDPTFIAD